jgi:hypothetical protein
MGDNCNKVVEAVIVTSFLHGDLPSIRGVGGHGIHQDLAKAGFVPDEKVVIVTAEHYDELVRSSVE